MKTFLGGLIAVLFLLTLSPPLGADTVSTIAGTGNLGPWKDGAEDIGDGGSSCSASVWQPASATVDTQGNLYIADTHHHRIRRVDAKTGIITTVAGNGQADYGGDNGLATSASLWVPSAVALDGQGNLYIADSGNDRIRRVDAVTRIITTIAGNGTPGFSGDGGAATSAKLWSPQDLVLDGSGNLYFTDYLNNRIRRIDKATGKIKTIAGTENTLDAYYNCLNGHTTPADPLNTYIGGPVGIGIDAAGNLYIAEQTSSCVLKLNAVGTISRFAGIGFDPGDSGDGGAATSAKLFGPARIALDAQQNVYIADSITQRIRKVDAATNVITTIAGRCDETDSSPLDCQGGFSGDGGPMAQAEFYPTATGFGISFGPSGNLLIADGTNNRIRQVCFSPEGCLACSGVPACQEGQTRSDIDRPECIETCTNGQWSALVCPTTCQEGQTQICDIDHPECVKTCTSGQWTACSCGASTKSAARSGASGGCSLAP